MPSNFNGIGRKLKWTVLQIFKAVSKECGISEAEICVVENKHNLIWYEEISKEISNTVVFGTTYLILRNPEFIQRAPSLCWFLQLSPWPVLDTVSLAWVYNWWFSLSSNTRTSIQTLICKIFNNVVVKIICRSSGNNFIVLYIKTFFSPLSRKLKPVVIWYFTWNSWSVPKDHNPKLQYLTCKRFLSFLDEHSAIRPGPSLGLTHWVKLLTATEPDGTCPLIPARE